MSRTRADSPGAASAAFMLVLALLPAAAFADGFHSSFIAKNITPREWWEYHKHDYIEEKAPAPSQQVSGGSKIEPAVFRQEAAGKSRESGGRQRALIAMVLNHLLYLNVTNIIPSEFPDFNKSSFAEFNKGFRDILVELGIDAVPFILDAYVGTLQQQIEDAQGLKRSAEFQADLVEVLNRIGKGSISCIAAAAAKTPGRREREALIGLIAKILEPTPALRGLPPLVKAALEKWTENGPALLALAEDAKIGGQDQAAVMALWLALALEKGGEREIAAFLRDRDRKEELRCHAVDFLASRGHVPSAFEFLALAVLPAEGLYLRRECLTGLWRIKLLSPEADMRAVTADQGLKAMITDRETPKVLRVFAIFLLAHLKDAAVLDALLHLVHQEGEDEGVLMAALEGIERLGLQARASSLVERSLLLKRGHIPAFRFKLLEIVSSLNTRDNAPPLVRIVLDDEEYPPMRVKALLALQRLRYPGYGKAEALVLEKTGFVKKLGDFVFEASASFNERAGVLADLETLATLQARGPISALFSSSVTEEAIRKGNLPDELLGAVMDFYLRFKGSEATAFVASLLGDPEAPSAALLKAAIWAGKWMVTDLAAPLRIAFSKSKDPTFRLAAMIALQKMGDKPSVPEIAAALFPKAGPEPDTEVFTLGLELLGSIGDRDSMIHLTRCLRPAHEPGFEKCLAALKVLGRLGSQARQAFGNVWTAYRKTELGSAEARTAFLECFLRIGPSQPICDTLVKQMRLEMQRLPFAAAPLPSGKPDEGLEQSRQILPALHAMALLYAYKANSAELFDLGKAGQCQSEILSWYQLVRKDLPRD